jgi:two-component system, NtrC family, response regulator AtoC
MEQKQFTIYLLDDNVMYAQVIKGALEFESHIRVEVFSDGYSLLKRCVDKPDMILLDYELDIDNPQAPTGEDFLRVIKDLNSQQVVVMLSSNDKLAKAVELLKQGAFDYVMKDDHTVDKIKSVIQNLREIKYLKEKFTDLKQTLASEKNRAIITATSAVVISALLFWLAA